MRHIAMILLLTCALPTLAAAQAPPPSAQAASQSRQQPAADASSTTRLPETAQAPDTTPRPSDAELQLPPKAQAFKFTHVDLDLLRQVDALDRYIEEKGWIYDDPETNSYLEEVGSAVVPKQVPEHVAWHFKVLRDPELNAFALPNGSMYVTSGLLARMENEAQLAGVLAHETTHVTNRHTYLEYHDQRKKYVAIDVIQVAAGGAGLAGPIAAGISNIVGTVMPVIVLNTMFGYSRELEHEADVYAVKILDARGYDLKEFARGFELLREGPEVDLSKEPVFWASHPKLTTRVQYVSGMAAQLQAKASRLHSDSARYLVGTRNAVRQDADLAMMLGRPRTAVAIAERLISLEPNRPEHHVLLGDAYRSLAARPPAPSQEELTENGKSEARKRMKKMTLVEYEKALQADPGGHERWQQNCVRSEEAFRKALQLDRGNAQAHRGLGFLYQDQGRGADAIQEYEKYLELAPEGHDARRVRRRLEVLKKVSEKKPT